MSQKPYKGQGVCTVCWASFKTHASDGTIHRHGPRSAPCPGSDQPPTDCPTKQTTATQPSSTASGQITSSRSLSADEAHPPLASRLSYPVSLDLLIKRIPKAARPSSAALLGVLIQAIVRDPNCVDKWCDLLAFGALVRYGAI